MFGIVTSMQYTSSFCALYLSTNIAPDVDNREVLLTEKLSTVDLRVQTSLDQCLNRQSILNFSQEKKSTVFHSRGLYHKTYHGRNLLIFVKS
jgi:hypothetical protein